VGSCLGCAVSNDASTADKYTIAHFDLDVAALSKRGVAMYFLDAWRLRIDDDLVLGGMMRAGMIYSPVLNLGSKPSHVFQEVNPRAAVGSPVWFSSHSVSSATMSTTPWRH
jgi:hypothetical protein